MVSTKKLGMLFGMKKTPMEQHAQPTLLSNFILGCQDGLVNVLGIILGVSAATSNIKIIFVATLAALAAESISMGAVAYTSTVARRRHYLKEVEREKNEMKTLPKVETEEVRTVFKKWGYKGRALDDLTNKIVSNPKAWLEFMMAHELDLEPVGKKEPLNSFLLVGLSTVFGSFIPLIPFFLIQNNVALGAETSVLISGVALFAIGMYEAKTTVGSVWKSGLQLAIIGLTAGLAGYVIGRILGASPV